MANRLSVTREDRASLLDNLARMRREIGDEQGAQIAEERADLHRWMEQHLSRRWGS